MLFRGAGSSQRCITPGIGHRVDGIFSVTALPWQRLCSLQNQWIRVSPVLNPVLSEAV